MEDKNTLNMPNNSKTTNELTSINDDQLKNISGGVDAINDMNSMSDIVENSKSHGNGRTMSGALSAFVRP